MTKAKKNHIGCQSWGYEDWITPAGGQPVFYPRGTKQSEMLSLYSEVFDTIEVDSTVYGTPAAATIKKWYEQTPANFTFSLKLPREITHVQSLGPGTFPVLHQFVDGIKNLNEKLGVMLIQLPASFEADKDNARKLREFLSRLPREFRFAIEFRDPGWFTDWTFQEIAESGVALSLVEGPWIDIKVMSQTIKYLEAPFAYIRLMEEKNLARFDRVYRNKDANLAYWKAKIGKLQAEEIFIYVDNYYEGHAPATVNRLKKLLGVPITEPAILETQGSLF